MVNQGISKVNKVLFLIAFWLETMFQWTRRRKKKKKEEEEEEEEKYKTMERNSSVPS